MGAVVVVVVVVSGVVVVVVKVSVVIVVGAMVVVVVGAMVVVVGAIVVPATGWLLDALQGYTAAVSVPAIGVVQIGPYRLVYGVLAVLALVSLLGVCALRRHRPDC